MGNKLVTSPNENQKDGIHIPPQTTTPTSQANTDKQTNANELAKKHHAKLSSIDPSTVPSECPMHQAKEEKCKQSEAKQATNASDCPIKGPNSDINPSNMVLKDTYILIYLILYRTIQD